jgi:hypothetical protein
MPRGSQLPTTTLDIPVPDEMLRKARDRVLDLEGTVVNRDRTVASLLVTVDRHVSTIGALQATVAELQAELAKPPSLPPSALTSDSRLWPKKPGVRRKAKP